MTDALTCPQCHAELPGNAPAGMCPRCLMEAALAESSDENQARADSPYAETTPQPRNFLPPESGVLADQFPQLEILELLGQGGMGAVYKARQPKLDRLVALKIIRPESADDPAFTERFNREARTLARLSHPNIVAVHDFGEVTLPPTDSEESSRTVYWFLMEYVDGANLRQLMDRGELSPGQVLDIVPQICDALQFAHDEGVVHRDIKPENILVDSRGRVKIADFGLAKLASSSEHDFTLTGTHQVMGTPRYMAPEQMAGSRAVDHRADLYALGVVFYEMLTGEIPAGHFSSPSAHAPIDVRLDDVVMKALAPKPEDRFQSASEIRASLEAISQESGESVFSQVGAPDLPPARGLSTVFERQFAAAWHWMADKTAPAEQTGSERKAVQFPSLLMGLLCVIGLLMPLAPWMIIAVTDTDVTTGIPSAELTMFHGSASKLIEKSGFEHPAGIASAILLTILAVLCLSVPSWRRPNRLIAFLMVCLSGCAFLSAFFFPNQAPHIYLDFNPPAAETEPGVTVVSSPSRQPISNLDHKIYLQPAFFGSVTVSGILLLLSAVGLRHAEPLSKTGWSWQKVWAGELASNLLLVSTIVLSLVGGLTILLPWAEIQIPLGADVTQVDDTARLVAPVTQSFSGTDVWSSTAAPGICLLVGFILLLSPQRRSPGWIVTGLMTVCSIAAVIHLATYPAALQSHRSITLPLEVSEQAARWLANPMGSGDFEDDPTNTKMVEINHRVAFRSLSKFVTYRKGYYTALGVSLSLLLLSVIGVRNAILNHEPQPKTEASWAGTPLASLRFTVPVKGDIGSKIRFHFLSLGYELEKEQPGSWIFQRGTTMGGMVQTDIRAYPTRLAVNSIEDDEGQYLVNCHWSVRLMGGWAGKSDIKVLEDEGRELQTLLGGVIDQPPIETAAVTPPPAELETPRPIVQVPQGEAESLSVDEEQLVPRSAMMDLSAVEDEVRGPAVAMMIVGLLTLVGHVIAIPFMLENIGSDDFVWMAFPGMLVGIVMLAGGIGLHDARSHNWAQAGIIAGFLPVTPAWFFTMMVSTWAGNVLSKPQVKMGFVERNHRRWDQLKRRRSGLASSTGSGIDFVAIEEEVSGPSIAMMTVGFLIALGHLTLFIFSMLTPYDREMAPLALPGLLIGIGMLVGGLNMNQLWSRGWAQLGIIAGFIPASFGWPLSLPLSIWALKVLSRQDVKAAFLQRKRADTGEAAGVTSSAEGLDFTALEEEVNGPSLAVMITGILVSISHLVWFMLCLYEPYDQELAAFAVPGLLVGVAMTLGGFLMRGFGSRGWVQLGLIAGMLPINAGWPISLPICLWANSVFRRRDVKQAFLETARRRKQSASLPDGPIDLVGAEDQVSVPAIAMIVLGVLMPLSHFLLISYLIESRNSTPSMVMCLIPGILLGPLLIVGGLCLRKFGSRGWAQVGIIAGMLPVSPLWIFSIGVCIWAQMLISKPEIRRAFLERKRRLRQEPIPPRPPRNQKTFVRPATLIALVVWSVIVIVGGMVSFAWLRGELSEVQIMDNRAGTLVPKSGAYKQVTVTSRGIAKSELLIDLDNVQRNQLVFQLTPLRYARVGDSTGKLIVELPSLAYTIKMRDNTDMASSYGFNPDVIREWMGMSGVDLNVDGVSLEARALFEIADKASETPPHDLVDPELFTVTPGDISKQVIPYAEWEHARYCFYVWLGGVVLVLLVTVPRGETAPDSLGRTLVQFATMIMILCGVAVLLYLAGGGSKTEMTPRDTGIATAPPIHGDELENPLPPLHNAAASGQIGRIRQLLQEAGTDINDKDSHEKTPLMYAAENNQKSTVLALIVMGANIEETDPKGRNAFMLAAARGHADLLQALDSLQNFAAKCRVDNATPAEAVERFKEFPGIDRRILEEVKPNALRFRLPVKAQDSEGMTAAMIAAANGDIKCLKALWALGDIGDECRQDQQGRTVLMHGLLNGHNELVLEFLEGFVKTEPAELSQVDRQGQTLYSLAAQRGATEVTDLMRKLLTEEVEKYTKLVESEPNYQTYLDKLLKAFETIKVSPAEPAAKN